MVLKTVTDSLSVQDFIFPAPVPPGQTRSDEYNFLVSIGNTPTQIDLVTLTPGYDPYLEVLDTRTNSVIFSNDDGGGAPNSRLNINTLQVGVPYKIRVTSFSTSFNQTIDNNYTLTVNTAQGDFQLEPRLSTFINSQSGINITKTGRLDDKDYTFPTPVLGTTSLADEFEFDISVPNQPIKIALNGLTSGYDPFLQIINARTGQVVSQDDDSGPGFDSLINGFTAQPGIDYRIRVTSFNQIVPNINNPVQYSLEVDGQGVSVTLAERGTAVNPPPDPLLNTTFTRFQNNDRRGTFLFAGPAESQSIRNNFPNFIEEGAAFKVAVQANDDLIRINRFQNRNVPGTFLFAGETESQSIRQNFPNFTEEGIAFYVYDGNANKGVDFFRFQNTQQPGTFIFVGEQERNNILANFPQFRLEGVAFEVAV